MTSLSCNSGDYSLFSSGAIMLIHIFLNCIFPILQILNNYYLVASTSVWGLCQSCNGEYGCSSRVSSIYKVPTWTVRLNMEIRLDSLKNPNNQTHKTNTFFTFPSLFFLKNHWCNSGWFKDFREVTVALTWIMNKSINEWWDRNILKVIGGFGEERRF